MLPACRATSARETAQTVQPPRRREFKNAWLDEPDEVFSYFRIPDDGGMRNPSLQFSLTRAWH